MAITGADLFFVAAERMIDNNSSDPAVGGGGKMGTVIVQDNVENNLFPDVMPGDRLAGVSQMRKAYAAVLSPDNDSLANAQAGLVARPSDANVEVCLIASGISGAVDSRLVSAIAEAAFAADQCAPAFVGGVVTLEDNNNTVTSIADTSVFLVGDRVNVKHSSSDFYYAKARRVTAITASSIEFDGPLIDFAPASVSVVLQTRLVRNGSAPPISGLSLTTAGVAAAATAVVVDRADVRVLTATAAAALPFDGSGTGPDVQALAGRQPLYFPGDIVLVQHPTVDATREFVTVARVNYLGNTLSFTTGLVNAYPTGTKVTRPVALAALRASSPFAPFSQQAWTRVWQDGVAGAAISARYSASVVLLNAGATTDRWACVFTSTTQFNILSERLGQVGSGNIGSNTSILNPLTAQPYFTLLAAGWGSGWQPGNAIRFNTIAAAAPVWVRRTVSPGPAGTLDEAALFMRGDVNA